MRKIGFGLLWFLALSMGILLLGGMTNDIQDSFNLFWADSLSVSVENLVSSQNKINTNYNALHQYACDPTNFVPKVRDEINNIPTAFRNIQQAGKLHWINGVEYISDLPGKNDGNTKLPQLHRRKGQSRFVANTRYLRLSSRWSYLQLSK